jgi:hypothetical protein
MRRNVLLTTLIFGACCATAQLQTQPGPPNPADLIGEWYQSNVSTIDFVNSNTGAHTAPSGDRLNVRFFPDGTYKMGWLLQSSLYGCTSTVFGYKVGVYALDGTALRMQERSYSLTSKDNCHPEWNYEKHPPLKSGTVQVRMARTKYGPAIVWHEGGGDSVYFRETGRSLLN